MTVVMRAQIETEAVALLRSKMPVPLATGETFSAGEPRFPTPLACMIARAEAATVRSWARKYALKGWDKHPKRNAGILWSVLDLLKLRLQAVMVAAGIHPADAAWRIGTDETPDKIAQGNAAMFVALINDQTLPSLMIFTEGGTAKHPTDRVSFHMVDPSKPIADVFAEVRAITLRDKLTLIDLRNIIADVETGLAIEPVKVSA